MKRDDPVLFRSCRGNVRWTGWEDWRPPSDRGLLPLPEDRHVV